jgi:hypothetical protein
MTARRAGFAPRIEFTAPVACVIIDLSGASPNGRK